MIWLIFLVSLGLTSDQAHIEKCLVNNWSTFAKSPVTPEKFSKMILSYCAKNAPLTAPERLVNETLKLHQLRKNLQKYFTNGKDEGDTTAPEDDISYAVEAFFAF